MITSRVDGCPSTSCTFWRKKMLSPVIFSTVPLNSASFSRNTYGRREPFSTNAIFPSRVITIPFSTTCSTSRQRFPVAQVPAGPVPVWCIGLTNGSRRPARSILLGAGAAACSGGAAAAFTGCSTAEIFAFAAVACVLGFTGFTANALPGLVRSFMSDAGVTGFCATLVLAALAFGAGFCAVTPIAGFWVVAFPFLEAAWVTDVLADA